MSERNNWNRVQCCFIDMHVYPNNLSTMAKFSSLFIIELVPACFPCNNKFNLSRSSIGLENGKFVEASFGFDFLIEYALLAGEISKFTKLLSLVILLPECLTANVTSSRKPTEVFHLSGVPPTLPWIYNFSRYLKHHLQFKLFITISKIQWFSMNCKEHILIYIETFWKRIDQQSKRVFFRISEFF